MTGHFSITWHHLGYDDQYLISQNYLSLLPAIRCHFDIYSRLYSGSQLIHTVHLIQGTSQEHRNVSG